MHKLLKRKKEVQCAWDSSITIFKNALYLLILGSKLKKKKDTQIANKFNVNYSLAGMKTTLLRMKQLR